MAVSDLNQQRIGSARASGGISTDPIYQAVLSTLTSLSLSGTILDYGAGTGSLTQILCTMSCFTRVLAVDVVDFSASVRHPKLEWLFRDLNDKCPVDDESCDAVVAVEVIEHLENPRFVAREWFRLLKPSGVVIMSTPNNESWRSILSLLFRGHFVAFTGPSYPAHITALLTDDIERIMREAGFEHLDFRFTNHGCIPKLTSMTWQRASFGKLRGLRYSDNIVCIGRKSPLRSQKQTTE